MARRMGSVLVLAAILSLLTACVATAATRYAAPSGTGIDPCENPAEPCNIYVAADYSAPATTLAAGDVIELAPGTYSDTAGDLGPNGYVAVQEVTVRGEPGKPRPVIHSEQNLGNWGSFFVYEGGTVSHLETENAAEGGSAVAIQGGTLDGVIARGSTSGSFTCTTFEGTVRNSVCLNEGGGIAIGVSVATFAGTHATTIRNSTAIATGPGSVGAEFFYAGSESGVIGAVDGKGLIAKGDAKDIIARGKETGGSGKGATTTVTLDHSDYATVETETSGGGTATITAPGTNANITAAPLLAADHIHQLPGSPTINKGAVDGESSGFDIDDQLRTLGPAPDIGADELGNPTTTSVACAPATILLASGSTSTCTVTVEDVGTVLTPPSGDVVFAPVNGLIQAGFCTLSPLNEAASTCSGTFSPTPGASGAHTITAVYGGDDSHEGSKGSTILTVSEPPAGGGGGDAGAGGGAGAGSAGGVGGSAKNNMPPVTQLKKHPPKRTSKRKARFVFVSNQPGPVTSASLTGSPSSPAPHPSARRSALARI